MVLSKISEVGGVIQGNWDDEIIVPAIADGTAKAGWLVGITAAGAVAGIDTDGVDHFVGILLEQKDVDMDTAITASKPVSVVIPQSGHLYGVFCADLGTSTVGTLLSAGSDAGVMAKVAAVENFHMARTYRYTDNDTVCIAIWD